MTEVNDQIGHVDFLPITEIIHLQNHKTNWVSVEGVIINNDVNENRKGPKQKIKILDQTGVY